MALATRIKLGLVVWLVAEVCAFVVVADLVGYFGAILLGMLTSAFGLWLIRRTGRGALGRLRAQIDGRQPVAGAAIDDTLAGFAAVLLLVPGFLTDVAGLLLAVPPVRRLAAARFGAFTRRAGTIQDGVFRSGGVGSGVFKTASLHRGFRWTSGSRPPASGAPRQGPASIDLAPEEWRHTEPRKGPIS